MCRETKDFVKKVYQVYGSTFSFTGRCLTRQDCRDYLYDINRSGYFNNARPVIELLHEDRNHDCHVHEMNTYQKNDVEASEFLTYLNEFVEGLAQCELPSRLKAIDQRDIDRLRGKMRSKANRIITNAKEDLKEQPIRV